MPYKSPELMALQCIRVAASWNSLKVTFTSSCLCVKRAESTVPETGGVINVASLRDTAAHEMTHISTSCEVLLPLVGHDAFMNLAF